jgi:hypothetical protein
MCRPKPKRMAHPVVEMMSNPFVRQAQLFTRRHSVNIRKCREVSAGRGRCPGVSRDPMSGMLSG